jgi:hypothetical protein
MNQFKKIAYRWKDRQLLLSDGPARGMIMIRHDDGTTAAIVLPLHAFDALWSHLVMIVEPETLTGEDEEDAHD